MSFYKRDKKGLSLVIKVTPGASRDAFSGLLVLADGQGVALAVSLRAPPVDGKANRALLLFLAKALGVRKSALSLLSGEKSRFKRILISEEDPSLLEKLDRLQGSSPPR